MRKLQNQEVINEVDKIEGWEYKNDEILKKFTFKNFIEAYGFISKVALISEKLNHHPDWSGVYNKVQIKLSTHEVGGVTMNDIKFARMVEDAL